MKKLNLLIITLIILFCGETTFAQEDTNSADSVIVKQDSISTDSAIVEVVSKTCIDCHIESEEGETTSIDLLLENLKGHPNVSKMVKRLPYDCLKCHKSNSRSGYLGDILHLSHLAKDEGNKFITMGGDCKSCHELDMETGGMTSKSVERNW